MKNEEIEKIETENSRLLNEAENSVANTETVTDSASKEETTPENIQSHKEKRAAKKESVWKVLRIVFGVLCGIVTLVSVGFIALSEWYSNTFDVDFKELLYTLTSPVTGTGQGTIWEITCAVLPWVILALIPLLAIEIPLLIFNNKVVRILRRVCVGLCAILLVFSTVFTVYAFRMPDYVENLGDHTLIYEREYVDPADVAITADGKTKNLIYIYLESMETTYASDAAGGAQGEFNYIPKLTELAKEGVTFTNKDKGLLGGFSSVPGTTWTIAALLATTSGVPFAFPLGEGGNNKMSQYKYFAPEMTTLGDVLEEKGYKQEFLCGSDAKFGGRKNYFEQHGNYEIFDLFTAREEGNIPEDYYVWWGYEDKILFEIAKDEVTELAKGDAPFNLTMLTVDAHHVNGYVCSECDRSIWGTISGEDKLKTVLNCTDKLVTEFVDWCKQQPFYEDTVIIITGDHPRMDSSLVKGNEFKDRTIYNCILNSDTVPAENATVNRTYSACDMFPTTLAALGFDIEGDRLGLGVNMYSGLPTLPESMGYYNFTDEVNKRSKFYETKFTYN